MAPVWGVAIGSPELAPCGGSSGDKEKDAKENGVSYDNTSNSNNTTMFHQGCYSNNDINTDTNIHDLIFNEVDMNYFDIFYDNYYDAWYAGQEHFNINTDLMKHPGGAKAAKKRRATDQTARNSIAREKRKNKYLETTSKKKRTWREYGASKTLGSPTGAGAWGTCGGILASASTFQHHAEPEGDT